MGTTQGEEVVPAPPPYTRLNAAPHPPPQFTAAAAVSPSSTTYAPPPGPPPSMDAGSSASGGVVDAAVPERYAAAPPPLSVAPPTYEPFSFADAYAAESHRPPRWHGPPVYNVYHDPVSGSLSFHLNIPSTLPPCACAANPVCQCGRRRPAVWHASKSGLSAKRKVSLVRLSPFSGASHNAFTASKAAFSSSWQVRDERERKTTELLSSVVGRSFKFVDGQHLTWTRRGVRLELQNRAELPFAILHTNVTPPRLELTAFTWARMPSDELECDFDGCTLRPLFGFVFRCRDCTEEGFDSFDVCEPHLVDECARHDPTHRFERLPRPFGEWDDQVRETPLLHMRDMAAQRQSQELVILTLACTLLDTAK